MKKEAVIKDEFIRKRMERQKRIRKRRLIIFFVFFIIMAISVTITLSLTVFFPIEKINVKGSQIYTSDEIIRLCGINQGDNLFTVSKVDAEKMLKANLPYVEKIEIERKLPDTLNIKVKDAEEFACYNANGRYYTVSSSGWVLKETAEKPSNLTEIVTDTVKCKTGTAVAFGDEKVKAIIDKLVSELDSVGLKTDKIDVKEKISIYVNVENRFNVFLGTSNNIKEKIRHLASMIKEIPKEKTGYINLSMWTSDKPEGTFIANDTQTQGNKEKNE